MIFTALMVAMPWPSIWAGLYGSAMEDRRVYTLKLVKGYLATDTRTFDGMLSYISGEYLWAWILDTLVRTIGLSIDGAFAVISIIVIYSASVVLLRTASTPYLVLLCNPIFVDLAFSQMRIALAVALASWAYLIRGSSMIKWIARLSFLVASSLVHTSTGVFIALFLSSALVVRGLPHGRPWARYAGLAALGILSAMVLGPWRTTILTAMGDRRVMVEYGSSSLKFYLIWLLLVIALTLDWNAMKPTVVRAYSVAVLFTALVGISGGSYSNRILAISLPVLLASMSSLSGRLRVYIVGAYVGYATIYWFYWLRLMA